jgi:hypothetical protein
MLDTIAGQIAAENAVDRVPTRNTGTPSSTS